MERRELLLSSGVVAAGLSGCLGSRSGENTDPESPANSSEKGNSIEYEQCTGTVFLGNLPESAREEVNTAIKNGVYETEGELLLSNILAIDTARLMDSLHSNTYYEMTVTTDAGVTRLRIEEKPLETELPSVENGLEDDITIDLRVSHAEEGLLLEDTITLATGESTTLDEGEEYRYGRYRATFKIQTGEDVREEEVTWTQSLVSKTGVLTIHSDEVGRVGSDAMLEDCQWNDEGELVSGSG